jgi:hypothetical protein
VTKHLSYSVDSYRTASGKIEISWNKQLEISAETELKDEITFSVTVEESSQLKPYRHSNYS